MQLMEDIYNTLKYEDIIKFFNSKFKYTDEFRKLLVTSDVLFTYYFTEKHSDTFPTHITSFDLIDVADKYCENSYIKILTSYSMITQRLKEEYFDEFLDFSNYIFNRYNIQTEPIINMQLDNIFGNLLIKRKFNNENTDKLIKFFIDIVFKFNNYSLYNENMSDINFINKSNINRYKINTQIFENMYKVIKSYDLLNYIIENNYFETFCLNLSIGNLHELYKEHKNKLDEFTCESLNIIIDNKYIEFKEILKQEFQLSDSAIEQYVKSIK